MFLATKSFEQSMIKLEHLEILREGSLLEEIEHNSKIRVSGLMISSMILRTSIGVHILIR